MVHHRGRPAPVSVLTTLVYTLSFVHRIAVRFQNRLVHLIDLVASLRTSTANSIGRYSFLVQNATTRSPTRVPETSLSTRRCLSSSGTLTFMVFVISAQVVPRSAVDFIRHVTMRRWVWSPPRIPVVGMSGAVVGAGHFILWGGVLCGG